VKLRTAIPILATSASILLGTIGLAIAQEPPQVRIPGRPQQVPQPVGEEPAQPPQPAGKLRPFRTGMEERPGGRVSPGSRVEFNLEDADLPDLVRFISRVTGKRFILPGKQRSIKATIASPEPVTAAEAYRAFLSILEINGMTVIPSGRYLKIMDSTGAEADTPFIPPNQAVPADDRFVTHMLRVANVSAEDVATLLARFKSPEGNVTAYAPTNTVIITDTGANIQRMRRILTQIDIPRTGEQIWIEPIHHANAADMASRLQELFPTGGSAPGGGGGSEATKVRGGAPRPGQPAGEGGGGQSTIGSRLGESRITSIIPDERTNSLILMATERAYLRMLEVIRALDIQVEGEGSIHVHELQYADAEEMASTLQALVGGTPSGGRTKGGTKGQPAQTGGGGGGDSMSFEGAVNVQPHKPTNSLLITSSSHDYAALRRVIERLDISPRQVFIEAVIMELSVNRSSSLGLSWHGGAPEPTIDGEQSLTVFGFDAIRTATPALNPDLLTGLAIGVRGPEIEAASELLGFSIPSFGVVLNAIAQSGDVNVLSTPHIMAMDNTLAEITVGANVPLQTSGLGIGSVGGLAGLAGQQGADPSGLAGLAGLAGLGGLGGGGLGGGVQRQNVGTTIRITPHINDAGEIRMEIEEEISEAQAPQGTLGVVPISQRMAKTQVVVRDQQTVVIGGLMRDRVTTSEDKIPILGDIPLLGVLFRRQSTTTEKTNLILFLTPYIIRGPEDLRAIFERKLRERQEFIDRYFVFSDQGYEPPMDYSRTRGLVSEILNTFEEIEVEQALLRELQARPPPVHVRRPAIGEAPIDLEGGGGQIIITPEGEQVIEAAEPPEPGTESNMSIEQPAVEAETE
jgi:general secretion pathway protein D